MKAIESSLWLLFLAILSSSTGCSPLAPLFPSGKELTLETPELPAPWRPLSELFYYELAWQDPEFDERRVRCPPGEQLEVVLPRLANSPVVVTPILSTVRGERRFLPGGALYPQDLRGKRTLSGSWERGFEALLFRELQRRGFAYFQVNQRRLEAELKSRCGTDPWRGDFDLVLRRLLEGSFRSSYLSSRDSVGTMRELPRGTYLSENFLNPPTQTREIGGRTFLVLEELYLGNHRYFHAEGRVELLLSNDGEHEIQWENFGIWK